MTPRPASMLGQLPCCGCGFDAISCDLLSLLMNVTVWPTAIVTLLALTPLPVSVTVAPLGPPVPPSRAMIAVPPPPGDGEEPPPHAESTLRRAAEKRKRRRMFLMTIIP